MLEHYRQLLLSQWTCLSSPFNRLEYSYWFLSVSCQCYPQYYDEDFFCLYSPTFEALKRIMMDASKVSSPYTGSGCLFQYRRCLACSSSAFASSMTFDSLFLLGLCLIPLGLLKVEDCMHFHILQRMSDLVELHINR